VRIVFFGTPPFAARILDFLVAKGHGIVAIVTRPDKPRGRSGQLQPSAVKEMALAKWPDIPLFQPEKASTEYFAAQLKNLKPDLFVVVAYGEIIKENLLKIPTKLCINIHASLLPKYRGAAPIQRVLMNGEKESGITIIEMVLKMDAGPMLEVLKTPIGEEMNFRELEQKLCDLSCLAIESTLEKIELGTIQKQEQNHEEATFALKITFEDRVIKWEKSAEEVHNQIRALAPAPGAFCYVEIGGQNKILRIIRSKKNLTLNGNAGSTLLYKKNEWIVACGQGALSLLEIQLEGKKSMSTEEFIRGNPHPPSLKF